MPLVTFGDLHAPAHSDPTKAVYELVEARIHDDMRPMPQPPNQRLVPADSTVLDAWIAAGAPSTSGHCATDGGPPPPVDGGGLSCTPDTHIKAASPWSMPTTTDDIYTCFGVDVTTPSKRHVIGMAPLIDNHTIVHHVLLYQADVSVSSTPAACSPSPQWRIVYGWAPGGKPFELPPSAGFAEEGTVHYVVQIHYNNINHLPGQTDASGFDLCTTDQLRPNDADIMAFGTTNISIPAHATFDTTCNLTASSQVGTLQVIGASPHMHQLGTLITTVDLPGGTGTPVDLGSVPNWSFQNQSWAPISATINPGDVIRTRCAWMNTTNATVTYGPYTENEMCFGFVMYYPKITLPGWVWAAPTQLATCAPTM
jgi:hypothetical protein